MFRKYFSILLIASSLIHAGEEIEQKSKLAQFKDTIIQHANLDNVSQGVKHVIVPMVMNVAIKKFCYPLIVCGIKKITPQPVTKVASVICEFQFIGKPVEHGLPGIAALMATRYVTGDVSIPSAFAIVGTTLKMIYS